LIVALPLYAAKTVNYFHAFGALESIDPVIDSGSRVLTLGFQITEFGKKTLETFCWEQSKALCKSALQGFAKDYGPKLAFFVLGMVVASLFGLDLRTAIK
jgi:hypothetical protein